MASIGSQNAVVVISATVVASMKDDAAVKDSVPGTPPRYHFLLKISFGIIPCTPRVPSTSWVMEKSTLMLVSM
jgi:hypothetical protein